jgi:hypothetical protein
MFPRIISTLDYLVGFHKDNAGSGGYLKRFAAQSRSRSQKWIAMPGKNWIASPRKMLLILVRASVRSNIQVTLVV